MVEFIYVVERGHSITFTKYKVVKEMANSYSVSNPEKVLPRVSYDFYRRIQKGENVHHELNSAVDYYISLVNRRIESLKAEINENELRIVVAEQAKVNNE